MDWIAVYYKLKMIIFILIIIIVKMTNICCNKIVKGEYGMKLRNRLKELRARDRLNQTELAKKAGVSRQTVSLIERGEYAPSVIIALKIAHIFGENVENVFYLKENSDEKMDENYRFTSSEYFARNFCSK